MSTATDNVTITSVIAAAAGHRTQGPYKAVMMKKGAGGPQLVWKTTDDGAASDFKAFVQRVLPSAVPAAGNGSTPAGVLGLDCVDVAFYRIDVPPVPDNQLGPIVRMQAESLLPLPPDRMQVAWRAEAAHEGKRRCSVAAARSDQLRALAQDVRAKTSRIILNAEAVVKAWTELFDGVADRAVLIHVRRHDTQILLAERGVLRHAVTVDVGADDLGDADAAGEQELFVHDVRNAMEMLDAGLHTETPVCVIGTDAALYESVIAALARAGIDARLSRPANKTLRYARVEGADIAGSPATTGGGQPVDAADICEYLEPIGLGLMALDGEAQTLNLFDGLLTASDGKRRNAPAALVWSLAAAAVIVIVCLAAWSAMDRAALEKLAHPELNKLIEQQKTRQLIASERPDVLALLALLTESAPPDMLLDNFEFKKGAPVAISSFAKSREELYAFQKKLEDHPDVSEVQIMNPTLDEKQNRINFKLQFKYKRFSEKR